MRNIICLSILVVLFGGCTAVPKALPMKEGMLPDFRVSGEITIENTSEDEKLRAWTGSIVDFLSHELERRGAIVAGNAPIVLKLNLTDKKENQFYAYWAYKCTVFFVLETGGGYMRHFQIEDVSGLSVQRACNFSVTKAVAEILTDDIILEYIKAEKILYE